MTTVITNNTFGISNHGDIYSVSLRNGSIMSDSPRELLETVARYEKQSHDHLFDTVTTWSFIRTPYASDYTRYIDEKNTPKTPNTSWPSLRMPISKESIAAAEWIEQNAKSRVEAFSFPGSKHWYFMFEDAHEAVLFKLANNL